MKAAHPANLKIDRQLKQPAIFLSLAREQGSERLFLGSSDAKIYHWDVASRESQPAELVGHESYVTGVALAGNYLVSGGYDGRLIWWDRQSRQPLRSVAAHRRWIRAIAATPDGRLVVSVADDMVCRVWDAERGELLRDLRGHAPRTPHHFPSMLYACAISPDGRYLATGDRVGENVVWDLYNGRQLARMKTPIMYTWDPVKRIHSIGGVRSLAFSHDSQLLAVGGMGPVENIDHLGGLARVEVFDWQQGQRTHEFAGDTYKGIVQRLAFHPQGDWLLAAGGDHHGFVKFFDLQSSKIVKQEKAPMHVHDFVLNEEADTVYAAGHEKIVVWRIQA